ncbi:MAG TPA: hypothetical protein VNE71_18575 [Myxococcota bacterium]|jgi:hypothetical protein|nr:hypothetical protein [Myxococcota bacterium]
MRRSPLAFLPIAAGIALAGAAAAFNPLPRPAPAGLDPVCADDPTVACDPTTNGCASGTCAGDPADTVAGAVARGTLTLITDEDVTGWDEGADASASRPTNARFTLLLQYEHNGQLRTFAETYRLTNVCAFGNEIPEPEPALCVPAGTGWSQPASEAVITDEQLAIVFTVPGSQVAKAIAADLTGNPATTARPYLDIVDRLPDANAVHDADPLASVQQLKVTIRVLP